MMTEFLTLLPPKEALELYLHQIKPIIQLASETIPTIHAAGRISAKPVIAPHPLPAFTRSTVDGYAVRAEDLYGASESLPAYLRVVGEVAMGKPAFLRLGYMEGVLIHTGGMLPENANAVVMLEHTQKIGDNELEVYRSVSAWENTLLEGEEVKEGEIILERGTKIRAVEIGGLMALGLTSLEVYKKPRVGIISSGDEIVSPDKEINLGQVRDVNTYSLSQFVMDCGGKPIAYGIIPDNENDLEKALFELSQTCDMILITAGSSVSARDYTARVINKLGEPGVLVHGVNIRPGKPTILALNGKMPIVGLPGNPLSAFVIATRFVKPILWRLSGLQSFPIAPTIQAILTVNLNSQAGREDWVPVKLHFDEQKYLADPVFGKSNMIFTLVKADGLICIPSAATGLSAGETVEVELLT